MKNALLGIFVCTNLCVFGQIDDSLNTLSLDRNPHFSDTVIRSEDPENDEIRQKGDPKIVLFKTLYIQKYQGVWLYDKDSCSIKRINATKMAYFSSGTQAVYCGLSWDANDENRKGLRSVSYPILKELSAGDTLRFTLTTLADRDSKFQPEIYISEKAKVRKGLLKNGNYLTSIGQVPKASVSDTNLVKNTILIPITKLNAGIKWVHLVNYEQERQRGFIIENDYRLGGTLDEEYVKVYFKIGTSKLDKEGTLLLDKLASELKKNNAIVLRGYADPSGQKDDNLLLAENRAKTVMNYLIEKGIAGSRIKIEEFDIGRHKSNKENRICTILVL